MPTTFDKLAKKSPKFGVSLVKREDFNKHEEEAAAQQEARASTGMSRTLRITYALRRDQALKAQGAMFFFSLKAVDDYLKNHPKKANVETGVRPAAAPVPQVPNRPHPMMVCACGDPNCRNSRQQPQNVRMGMMPPPPQQRNPNEIPPFIRQLAEDLGTQMGAQHVMVVGIPLNPANPRTEPPSQAEFEGLLRAILGGN